jgi:DNA-binding SARP family transcriptional activator
MSMNGKTIYRQQYTRCGKERCRKCREGEGHGPYWYAYWNENGRTRNKYIGLHLPPELMQTQQSTAAESHPPVQAQDSPTCILRVYLLGQFQIEQWHANAWQAIDSRTGQHRRARALLGCLLSAPGRRLSREQAMKQLWPDLERDIAANRLNGAVHELRSLLEPDLTRPADSRLLRLEHTMLELADSSLIWVDAEAFEQLLREAAQQRDSKHVEQLLQEAAALYRGSYLLEELYTEWAIPRRDELQQQWITLHLKLANLRTHSGALLQAIEDLDRVRTIDPLNEAALQHLMVLLTRLHRRGEALQIYHQHANLLRRDYECDPSPETLALYDMLCQGRIPATFPPQEDTHSSLSADTPDTLSTQTTSIPLKQEWVRPVLHLPQQGRSSFVGRQQELERMRQILLISPSAIESHSPHCLLLTGAPGIGKTRLAEVLSHEAYTQGWAVAWSRSKREDCAHPYQPWITLLSTQLPGFAPTTTGENISTAYPPTLPLEQLGARLSTMTRSVASSTTLLKQQEHLHFWDALLETLCTLCKVCPLLLVLDDLPRVSDESINLLGYLLNHIQQQPIMILATCRDGELHRAHKLQTLITDLQHKQAIVTLPVPPLPATEIGKLVAYLPPAIAQWVQKQAGGNPFFAEELASQIAKNSSSDDPTLPASLVAVFTDQLSQLSALCRTRLIQAAHLGGAFTLEQLLAFIHDQDEDAVLDLLEEALQAKLLLEKSEWGGGIESASITYHYWHPLFADYLKRYAVPGYTL